MREANFNNTSDHSSLLPPICCGSKCLKLPCCRLNSSSLKEKKFDRAPFKQKDGICLQN